MFKEDETQYCPMCEEWAAKYEKLEKALLKIRHEICDMQVLSNLLNWKVMKDEIDEVLSGK